MAEQDQDRSEQATPFKLEEARRRGQVAKSLDVNSFFMIAAGFGILIISGGRFLVEGLNLQRSIFEQAPFVKFEIPDLIDWFGSLAFASGMILAPLFVTLIIVSILSSMVQTGPIFTFFPLKPDPKRLNPIQGFKRIFSKRMLFEAVKTLIKLSFLSIVAYFVVADMFPSLLAMPQVDPKAYAGVLMDSTISLVFKLVLVLLIVAILDLLYTRWEYGKKMRMSKREMKEEVKRREGDPHVRAKIKELQREAAKRSKSLGRVPEADVLITNPTHFAVALKYERGSMSAPRLIAKGAGEVVAKMKAVAMRSGVPIMERPPLARLLFREVDIDQAVPESAFEPVARVYAEIYAARQTPAQVQVRIEQ